MLGAGDVHFAAAAATPQPFVRGPSLITLPTDPGISPNFPTSVRMIGDVTIAAGAVVYADNLPYFYTTDVSIPPWPVLTNNGTMWMRSYSASHAPECVAVFAWNFGVIRNNGLIVGYGSDVVNVIEMLSHFEGVVNTGGIYAFSERDFATAIREGSGSYPIINSGVIAALSLRPDDGLIGSAMSRAIYRENGGRILNYESGQILAEGSAAIAIQMMRGHQVPFWQAPYDDIVNSGLIEARSLDTPKPSIAIELWTAFMDDLSIVNSGIIRSDIAILADGNLSNGREGDKKITNLADGLIDGAILLTDYHEKLINHGRIEGDIDMAGGSDLVQNEGTIIGRIDLGDGADMWRSLGGLLDGAVFGGPGADILGGGASVDLLNGEAGADIIIGGGGADQLNGGADADFFRYLAVAESTAAAFDTITGFVSGQDRIDLSALAVQSVSIQADGAFNMLSALTASGTLVVRVEGALTTADLILSNIATVTGTANADELRATAGGSVLTGGDGDDTLIGGIGNDRLVDGDGVDTMIGGAGDDVYTVHFTGAGTDLIWEFKGEGRDTVEVYLHDTFYLPENVENVIALDPDFSVIYGNVLSNQMIGNAGANAFTGGAGDDLIDGGAGADRLQGDAGGDRLTGGSGADLFIYTLPTDSMDTAYRSDGAKRLPDFITDFTQGEDKIDLRAIQATDGRAFPELFVFDFIGTNAFSHQAGQLRYDLSGGFAHIFGDTDGDGLADLHIVTNAVTFVASDFFL